MIGQRLSSRYEITGELGRGGMGVVYRARDPLLNRDVAIKLIPPSLLSADAEQRFQREAQLVAQMDHPAIVSIYDFGRHEDSLFFVMALVQGTNLRAFLRESSLLGDVLDVGIQVAEALDYSHAHGIVHRDIKPENVMVSREAGVGVRVRVMDFGLARASTESRLTRTGTFVGTLGYVSPEQVSAKPVDGRADIYALGTVLYECLVGQPPFTGESQAVLYRIVHEFPQSPRELGAAVDDELDAVVMSCLKKDPAQRPQHAGEVAEALKRYRARLRDSDRERSVTGLTRSFLGLRPALAPFIGRSKESAELQQRLNAAIAGECQFVVVSGEPGIGKTRLLDELANLAKARQIRVLHGRSVEQGRAFPYQGFCEVIQEYFRVKETGSSAGVDFSDLAADLQALFPMLNEIPEIRAAATGESKLARGGTSGPESRTQIFELLARTLTRIAGGKPLVLILEDLHGAEVTIEALPYIVTRLGPTPTLILGTYRTTEVDRRHPLLKALDGFRGDRRFSALALGPFSSSDHRAFLETLVGGAGIPDSVAQRLYEGTEGNPFFTKELVRSLLDSGGISRDDTGQWSLSGETGLSGEAMPATIQEVVERRIDRLPEDQREILSMASVIGRTFDSKDVEALAKGLDIDEAIDRLVQQGLIEEERASRGELLSFASGVVRDVLYASLSPRKRRSLHRRCAEVFEARHAGHLERVLPQLVHHFHQGDVPEKTVEYALHLAQASLDAFSVEEAVRSAKTALDFLDAEWEGDRSIEGDARTILARAHRLSGDTEAALREASAAIRVFEREKRADRAVATLLLAAETAWQARQAEEAARLIAVGVQSARAAGGAHGLKQLLTLGAIIANLRGEQAKANAYLEEAAGLSEASTSRSEAATPRGGRLVVGLASPVQSIEPPANETLEPTEIAGNVFETLLTTDDRGNLAPLLCERWDAEDAGRRFVLTLRPDIRFHGGRSLTAGDVKESFERAIREMPKAMPAAYSAIRGAREFIDGQAQSVSGIVVRSGLQLEISLLEPLPIYPALLSDVRTGIRQPDHEGAGLGTGPFRIDSVAPDRIVLARNDDYWRGALPLIDAIEFRPGLRASSMALAFRSGELDVARDLLPQDLEEILRDPAFRAGLAEIPKKDTYFVLFNSRTGPVARHQTVRDALAGVVRTRELVWRTLGRFAEPAVCLIPPGMLGHDPGTRRASLDADEARELLRSANPSGPIRLKASVHPLLQDRYGALTQALFETWSELGVEVEVVTPDMESFLAADANPDAVDMKIGRWLPDYDDPDNMTHTLFQSQSGRWRNYYASAEADAVLEEARSEKRPAVRESCYRRFETLLRESAALIPLFHDIDYRLAGPKVRGLGLTGRAPFVNYSGLGKVAAVAAEPEAQGPAAGMLQVPIAGVVSSLDPALCKTFEQTEVIPVIFESLTSVDPGAAGIVPGLAAEWRVEDEGRSYRFRLREDVRFHDGRRLSARDVRYSFERLLQIGEVGYGWMFASVKGAKALLEGAAVDLAGFRIHSALEFTIELEKPIAFFPALVSYPAIAIVPEGADPSGTNGIEGCVGTGPFRVAAFEPGRRLHVERNRSYWRKGYPRSEGLVYSFGVSPQEMVAGLRSGRFSLAQDLFPNDVEALIRQPEFASSYRETPRLSTYYVAFNVRGRLADRNIRQRLTQAVDVAPLVRQTVGRMASPAHSLIPPGLLGHEAAVSSRAGSAAPAMTAASAAIELTAALHPVYFAGYSALARELTAAFARQGIKIHAVNKSMDEWLEATTRGTVDMTIGRWAADFPDPDSFAYLLHSEGGFLGKVCGSAAIDRLIERARAEAAPTLRHKIYREIEETVAREGLLLPLFHEQVYRFARPEVEGLSVSFGNPAVAYEELRIRG